MERLDGCTAILSGGLGDIGQAIARALAGLGARVALGDVRDAAAAADLLDAIGRAGARARYDRVDVSDAAAVADWVRRVEADLGVPDRIIPNAAIVTLEGIRTLTPEAWARELQVNLSGAFHLAQAGALRLLHHGMPGRIVFLGSWAAHAPHPHLPAYCVAKAGLRMLCKTMALDLAADGILVNEIAPGYVQAGLSRQVFEEQPERGARARGRVPVGALITPDEVAAQVAHLCAPGNRHMTGGVLLMDGGLSLVSPASDPDG